MRYLRTRYYLVPAQDDRQMHKQTFLVDLKVFDAPLLEWTDSTLYGGFIRNRFSLLPEPQCHQLEYPFLRLNLF